MADIRIHRDHALGLKKAREIAWAWAEPAFKATATKASATIMIRIVPILLKENSIAAAATGAGLHPRVRYHTNRRPKIT